MERAALIEGSACWAAKFNDEKLIESLWEEYRKDRKIFERVEDVRPPLLGYDRYMSMLTNIANLLIAQRMDTRPELQRVLDMLPTPIFPKEAIELRWKALARNKRDTGIEQAQALWDKMVEESGVRPNG